MCESNSCGAGGLLRNLFMAVITCTFKSLWDNSNYTLELAYHINWMFFYLPAPNGKECHAPFSANGSSAKYFGTWQCWSHASRWPPEQEEGSQKGKFLCLIVNELIIYQTNIEWTLLFYTLMLHCHIFTALLWAPGVTCPSPSVFSTAAASPSTTAKWGKRINCGKFLYSSLLFSFYLMP